MYLLFDFDGTIVDSLLPTIDSMNELSRKYGFAPIQKNEIESIREKGLKEIIKERKISMLKVPFLIRDMLAEQKKKMHLIHLHDGMKEALQKLSVAGHQVVVLTSNNEENVLTLLKKRGVACVQNIYGGIGLFEKEKSIRSAMKEMNASPNDTIYIGDEVRDVESAHAAGIKIIAVDWGLNTGERLRQAGADWVVTTANDLFDVFFKWKL